MTAPGEYKIDLIEKPSPGPHEVLVKMTAVAVCGSDPKLLSGESRADNMPPRYPFVPGHEGAGVVEAVGDKVWTFKPGDRVAAEAHLGCGVCPNCREGRYNLCIHFGDFSKGHRQYGFTEQGCFAQYCVYHPRALHHLPDSVTDEEGALADTLATGLHSIRMVGIKPGGMTGIIGNGPVGLGVQIITQALGSRTIVVGNSARLGLSLELGAAHVFDYRDGSVVESLKKATGFLGVDQVFDCAGNSHSVNTALSICRRGGRIGLIAVPSNRQTEIFLKAIMWDELSVIGSRGNPNCHDAALSMIAEKQINPQSMITHRYPIERFSEAIQVVQNRLEHVMKVIITIN